MAAMEWGEGTPWRPLGLREDARGGGVAGSMEGRGGSFLESPWSGVGSRHGVGDRVAVAATEKKRTKGGGAVETSTAADAK